MDDDLLCLIDKDEHSDEEDNEGLEKRRHRGVSKQLTPLKEFAAMGLVGRFKAKLSRKSESVPRYECYLHGLIIRMLLRWIPTFQSEAAQKDHGLCGKEACTSPPVSACDGAERRERR